MPTWAILAIVLLGVIGVGFGCYAVVLRRQVTALTAKVNQQASHSLDLVNLNHLLRHVAEADWQSYPAVLVKEIVTQGYAAQAAILAVGEQGQVEIRAHMSADGVVWDPRQEPGVHIAMLNRERLAVPEKQELYLPIPEKGDPLGLLVTTGSRDANNPGPVLEACSALIHLALTHQRTLTRQLSLSTTDGLTGLTNHRHFQQALSVLLAQSYLEHAHLVLIMLDIDHFKHLNDSYGHLFGDLVLREIGGVIRHNVPAEALTARYGGEEFTIVLPGHSLTQAAQVAEQVRGAIEAHQITDPGSGHPVGVTISAGISSYTLGMGKSRLIARADEALYISKQSGRNRVTVLPPESDDKVAATTAAAPRKE